MTLPAGVTETDLDNAVAAWIESASDYTRLRASIAAALAAALAGRVVVPREPTPAMIDAARSNGFEGNDDHVRSDYAAMITAAVDGGA